MLKEIIAGVNDIEEKLHDYSEMNTHLYEFNKLYLIASNSVYRTPEYNHQPYTFKYGDFSISDYVHKFFHIVN